MGAATTIYMASRSHSCYHDSETTTALLLVIAIVFLPGLFIAAYQYLYKSKKGLGMYQAMSLLVYGVMILVALLAMATELLKAIIF